MSGASVFRNQRRASTNRVFFVRSYEIGLCRLKSHTTRTRRLSQVARTPWHRQCEIHLNADHPVPHKRELGAPRPLRPLHRKNPLAHDRQVGPSVLDCDSLPRRNSRKVDRQAAIFDEHHGLASWSVTTFIADCAVAYVVAGFDTFS